jgi:hypothetical protein
MNTARVNDPDHPQRETEREGDAMRDQCAMMSRRG